MDTHAIVIGAGPAGASCASWLAQQGIPTTVLEAAPEAMPLLARLDLKQDWVLGAPGASTAELGRHYTAHLRSLAGVTLRCGARIAAVESLARDHKALRLGDGPSVTGQVLVIATGLRPRPAPWLLAPGEALLDAVALTLARDRFAAGHHVLLLGAGDNAAENALFLARRGHRVTLWARGGWRAQDALRHEVERSPAVELRLHTPLPDQVAREGAGWRVSSTTHGSEAFDEAAALFGFEPDDRAWNQLRTSDAWRAAGWPDVPLAQADALAAEGIFLAGDVSQRLHPTIQTALADGVTAAKQAAHWLSRERTSPMTTTPSAGAQTLSLRGLRFDANVGILDQEKQGPQPISVDAELHLGAQPLLPRDDEITHVLDYRKVRKVIIEECTAEHINLLESMVGKLALRLLALPGVQGVRVRVAKLEIFDDCEVAIAVEAGRWPVTPQ